MKVPNRMVLKLNADWSPFQMTVWQEVIPLLLEGTVSTVCPTGMPEDEEIYRWDDGSPILIRSGPGDDGVTPRFSVQLPAVVLLRDYVSVSRHRRFSPSRHNIFMRDGYCCMYCKADDEVLTIDHVWPRSKGGLTEWGNVVSACGRCQSQKRDRTLEEMRHSVTWNGLPFRLQHIPTEVRKNGIARYVYRVGKHNLCWLNYLHGWEKIAPRIGKGNLIDEFRRWKSERR